MTEGCTLLGIRQASGATNGTDVDVASPALAARGSAGRRVAVWLFGLLVASYFFSYFFRVCASVILPHVSAEWGMSATAVGLVSSLYFYAYAFMQPVSGALNDRFGPLRIVASGMAVTGVGALLMGTAGSALWLSMGRLLTGLGLAPMLSGALVFQAAAFEDREYTRLSSITLTVGNLGAVVSVAPLEFAVEAWGRRAVFAGLALVNLLLAAALISQRSRDPVPAMRARLPAQPVWGRMREAFATIGASSQLRAMMMIWAVSFGALMALQGLWAVSWLRAAYGVAPGVASAWATLIGVGVMAGNFAGGYLGNGPGRRRQAIAVACTLYGALWVALVLEVGVGAPLFVAGLTGLALGVTAGVSYVQLTAGVNDLAPNGKGGALFGAINLFTFVGVILFQAGTGFVLHHFSTGTPGAYTPEGYLVTMGSVAGTVVASLVALAWLPSFGTMREEA